MSDKNGWVDNGVEGCSQTTGDWIDQNTPDCISMVGVEV